MSQNKYAEKIAKLLRQAESVPGTPEADAFIKGAQELQTKWQITEEMLAVARGDNMKEREEIIREHIRHTGSYSRALYDITATIARANDCQVLISKGTNYTTCVVIGHESDVEMVKVLDSSLQIQAARALNNWWKTQKDKVSSDWYTASEKYKMRRDFLFGFGSGVGTQLYNAKKLAREEFEKQEAERQAETAEKVSTEVGLALRNKEQRVSDWMDKTYGNSLRPARGYTRIGYSGGYGAGSAAGRSADVGRARVGGGSKAALGA